MTIVTEIISGRSIPRNQPRAEPCDVRFRGDPHGGITAWCAPCEAGGERLTGGIATG